MRKDPETNENATRATREACGALAIIAGSRTLGKGKYVLCSHCGKEIKEGAKFCTFCGKPLAETSESVSEENNPIAASGEDAMSQTIGFIGQEPLPKADLPADNIQGNPSPEIEEQPLSLGGFGYSSSQETIGLDLSNIPKDNYGANETIASPIIGILPDPEPIPMPIPPEPQKEKEEDKKSLIFLIVAGILFVAFIAAGIFFLTGGPSSDDVQADTPSSTSSESRSTSGGSSSNTTA